MKMCADLAGTAGRLGAKTFLFAIFFIMPTAFCSKASSAVVPPSAPRAVHLPANPRNLADLIEGSVFYDNQRVTLRGEAVGDLMTRGPVAWVNLYDGTATIGAYGPTSLLRRIESTGSYNKRGDEVRVSGIFHRADTRQGGELVIEATELTIVKKGYPSAHPVTYHRLIRTAVSLAAAFLLGVIWWFKAHRPRASAPRA
ncbi:MAG: OB-fold nucleic acid binding domain-containing protein [Bacteroidota bacterium]